MNDEPQHKHRKYWLLCIFAVFIAILGIVLPEIDVGETVYINATTINVSGFSSYTGCTITNISEINNLNCSGVEAVGSPWLITVNFTNITHFDFLEVKHRYYSVVGKATDVNDIEIYCKTERSYISLFRFSDHIQSTEFTRNIPDVEHFIDNGNVSIRLNHSETGNANDRYILDTVRLIQKPTFNQVTATTTSTTSGAGCTGNCSFNYLTVNSLGKNDTLDFLGEIRTLSPFGTTKNVWHSTIDISDGSVSITSENTTTGNYSIFSSTPEFLALAILNSAAISLNISQDRINIISGVRDIMINESGIDLNNGNLTNCANCGGNQNIAQVLAIGNDANRQNITNVTNISMAGRLNISIRNGTYTGFNIFGTGGQTPYFTAYENATTVRTEITLGGAQVWRLRDLDTSGSPEIGYIAYGTPGGLPGIILYNSTLKRRTNMFMVSGGGSGYGLLLNSVNDTTFKTTGVLVDTQDNLTVSGLAGIGSNYPVRADSTGKLNVNRTAGAGITMKSSDGNSWCITVSNAGAMAVAAGACP